MNETVERVADEGAQLLTYLVSRYSEEHLEEKKMGERERGGGDRPQGKYASRGNIRVKEEEEGTERKISSRDSRDTSTPSPLLFFACNFEREEILPGGVEEFGRNPFDSGEEELRGGARCRTNRCA